jgi:hypothetical protein
MAPPVAADICKLQPLLGVLLRGDEKKQQQQVVMNDDLYILCCCGRYKMLLECQ